MATDVLMPQMGESIAEGTITKWLVKVGQKVERDQPLFEISTDKVDAEIPSPATGTLAEVFFAEGSTVPVNQVVGRIAALGEALAPAASVAAAVPAPAPAKPPSAAAAPQPAPAAVAETPTDFDLVVIGSGPGGYVAAIRAAQLGLKVAVVEKDSRYGGTCLLRGCIPTKALLHTAEVLEQARHAADFGVELSDPRLDMLKAQVYKRKIVDANAKGVEYLFKKNKVEGIAGVGRLVGPHEVEVRQGGSARRLRTRFVLVATGSVPREIGLAPTDSKTIVNSDHILELEKVPRSLVVLGAGAVGTEFASIFASFGCEVTLVEMLPRVLPIEDEEVSAELERALKKRGIKVLTGAQMKAVEKAAPGPGVRITVEKKGVDSTLEAEMLLVAVGRKPVSENLGLEDLGIAVERGYVGIDPWMRTSVPSVYAIGDVVNTPWLAHVASAEGILAVEHMAGFAGARPIDYGLVPSCTYCEPEVASVGLTEAKARELGHDVAVGKFPWSALAKSKILGKTAGFVKVVREKKYDAVLGIHIIGPHATDLIGEACVALRLEITNEELLRTMHPHPTLSEAVAEAAHAAEGHALHI